MRGDDDHEDLARQLGELVNRLKPQVKELLARYCVSEEAAGEIVYEALMGVAQRWHRVGDRDLWFLRVLEHACASEGQTPASDA